MHELLVLNEENPFKVRAFEKAAAAVAGRTDLEERARAGTLTELEGIGKGIAAVLTEYLVAGKTTERDGLRAKLPEGLWALTRLSGLGPKKARQVIDELGITSVGELEYACRENRLLKIKGFGEKAQEKILDSIEFSRKNEGKLRIDTAFAWARKFIARLDGLPGAKKAFYSETGALRRRLEVVERLEFLIDESFAGPSSRALETMCSEDPIAVPVQILTAPARRFGYELARTTATAEHWQALGAPEPFDAPDEAAFFSRLALPVIPPEMRETAESVRWAKEGALAKVLPWDGIRGVFHNHTIRSDGAATLEEMVLAAKKRGYSYIGISDHSQSAFYAQGLKLPELLTQEKEVRALQEKHPEIRIFWGIESDILVDGSLDYEAQVLKKFDFVVASIHSRFQMGREAMTDRLLEAVRHPATRFLGHVTGRLLLGRKGYDCDLERVIREAARCDVAIEINANPARLDIDWRWGGQLRQAGTLVSVNPDAHDIQGLDDTVFGVAVARKALLPAVQVVNARSVEDVARWLKRG